MSRLSVTRHDGDHSRHTCVRVRWIVVLMVIGLARDAALTESSNVRQLRAEARLHDVTLD